ncbi:MAG: hypothetical protein IT462_16925 [Planctomycetes bacterium]|nr:hypothetical protein [Planctomycetota bacterium]
MALNGTKRRKTRGLRKPGALSSFVQSMIAGVAALVIVPFAGLAKVLPRGEWFTEKAKLLFASIHVRRIAGVCGGMLLVVGLCVVMKKNLEASPMYNVDPGRIALVADVTWAKPELALRLRGDIEADLRLTLSELGTASCFDDASLPELAAALERNAWVAKVARIERRFPREAGGHAELRPMIDLRRPALAVETEAGYVLVDGEGVRIPIALKRGDELNTFTAGLLTPLRVVRGVTTEPPATGKRWESQEIAAAISMERVLRESAMDSVLPIEAMELVGVPAETDARGRVRYRPGGGVVLIPDRRLLPGTSLLWGRPPVHASTLEPTLDEKIAAMRVELANPGKLKGASVDLSVKRG